MLTIHELRARRVRRFGLTFLALIVLSGVATAQGPDGRAGTAESMAPESSAPAAPLEDAIPRPGIDPNLDADAIYERVLANRFDASAQNLHLISGDRAGRKQTIEILMLWRRYPDGSGDAKEGILSRTLARYLEPFDLRNTGYLVINKADAPNDQFVYLESMRRVRRISLRSESVIGTDLSVEDIIPKEMDEASYLRIPDEEVDGKACYVIDATPTPAADSAYSKMRLYIEGAHYVPLRTRYWDQAGVEVKELTVDPSSIREIDGIWIPLSSRMRQVIDDTFTQINLVRITPNPDLPKKFFTARQLEAARLRLPKEINSNAVELE